MDSPPESRPNPDPSTLTTDALQREIGQARETARIALIASEVVQVARFESLDRQLASAEKLRLEQKKDSKEALDAALAAQKEAVGLQTEASEKSIAKSEAATNKQIEQLHVSSNAAADGQRSSFNDLKDRVARIESGGSGRKDAYAQMYPLAAFLIALASLAVAAFR